MIRNSREENILVIHILELVDSSANPYHAVDLRNILDWNVTFDVIHKIAPERSEAKRSTGVPNQHEAPGILVLPMARAVLNNSTIQHAGSV